MRLGLVIPSVNTVIEDDLRRFSPADVSSHVTRIALTGTTPDALKAALAAAAPAAALLAHAGVAAVALACTGASLIGGRDGGASQALQAAAGVPALDTMEALVAAFQALGARRILLFSPFDDAFNAAEAASLSERGFEVVGTIGLGIRNPGLCPDVAIDDIVDRVIEADTALVDVVFLSCANLRGFEAVATLEARLGKPVVTSNQAVLWALLRLAGSNAGVAGGGRLFAITEGIRR